MRFTARFWFSGLEKAVEFEILESDFHRFQSYLAETEPTEFFEFDTPGHTVVLTNMAQVDAVKLVSLPDLEPDEVWEEEPSEAVIQLVGRFEAFSASTSEEHLGPDHPVRRLLEPETGKFVQWLDARGQGILLNPAKLSYVEHPKYWIEEHEDWSEGDVDAESDSAEEAALESEESDD